MSTHSKLAILGAAGLLLVALPAPSQTTKSKDTTRKALIQNTGSTNTLGYFIVVEAVGAKYNIYTCYPDGRTEFADRIKMAALARTLPALFTDLDAAGPLAQLSVRHAMHSASFGTQTLITYKDQKSPDLTGGGNAKATALRGDIQAIVSMLGIKNMPRHPLPKH